MSDRLFDRLSVGSQVCLTVDVGLPFCLQTAFLQYLPSVHFQFLGCTEVDQAKGMEVVKAGIRKMRVWVLATLFR